MNSQLFNPKWLNFDKLSDEIIDSLPDLIKSSSANSQTTKSQSDFFDPSFKEKGSFGIRISKGGTRTFFLIYKDNKKNKRVSIGRYPEINTKEARSRAISLLRRIRLSKSIDIPDNSNNEKKLISSSSPAINKSDISFLDLSLKFIQHSKINGLSDKTLKEYQRILNKEVIPNFGDFPIRTLKKYHFIELYEDILLRRKKRVLANRVHSLLHRIFEFAIEREIRQTNPIQNIKKVLEYSNKKYILEVEQIRKLYKHLLTKTSESAQAVLFMIYTGQSLKRVCLSKWEDFIQGHFAIYPSKTKKSNTNSILKSEIKNSSEPAFLYLNDLAKSLLEKKFELKKNTEFVFSSQDGKPLRFIEKSIRQFGREISIEIPLTSSLIRKSLNLALLNHRELISPPIEKSEITYFYNPKISLEDETGMRPALLIQELLLSDTDNFDRNITNKTKDSLSLNTDISSRDNVIFIPEDKWKRNK